MIRSIALLAVGVLCGIHVANAAERPSAFVPPPEELPVRDGFLLTEETITERDIPAYFVQSEAAVDSVKAAVILLHGGSIFAVQEEPRTTSKEDWLGIGGRGFEAVTYELAENGLLVVIIDHWWAGERFRPEHREMIRDNPFNAVCQGFFETAYDVSLVIDYLETREDVDAERIGVAGWSGGGHAALVAAVTEPRLKAVVGWVTCADFIGLAKRKGFSDRLLERFQGEAPNLLAELHEKDPTYAYAEIPPKAIAIFNNRNDPAIPSPFAVDLYEKLLPLYADAPERLSLTFFDPPEPTHVLDPEGYMQGCEWLIRFLHETQSSS